jgi:ribulose-5-phosphate 4-epimerase/fuculose-1-phosphate aldolase
MTVQLDNALLDTALVDLVDANRILYNEGIVDGLGHVSVRDPNDPQCFWLSHAIAPGLVTREDLIQYTLAGDPVRREERKGYLERYIHGEIYRARPEIHSVVHSHSEATIVFGVTGSALRALTHMHHFLREIPIFEIRGVESNERGNLLVNTPDLGVALVQSLGDAPVGLMRGHGMVTVGKTIREAVFRAIYAEQNARLQTDAMRFGVPITYLNDDEMAYHLKNAGYDRAWGLWRSQAHRALGVPSTT